MANGKVSGGCGSKKGQPLPPRAQTSPVAAWAWRALAQARQSSRFTALSSLFTLGSCLLLLYLKLALHIRTDDNKAEGFQ